jgi:hypothetical protein
MNKLLLLISLLSLVASACSSSEEPMQAVKMPKAAKGPGPAFTFEQLLYENDYNAVPLDDDPAYYVNDLLDSALIGMAYQLPNNRAFAPGVFAVVPPPQEKTWYKASLRALKKSTDMRSPLSARGQVVFSWERAGNNLHYHAYPIKELLEQQNKQIIDKWETVEVWQEVPDDLQQGDVFKAYVWNAEGGILYIDDFMVTAWTAKKRPIDLEAAKTRLLVEQGYEHEVPSNDYTTKYAHRGVYSNMIANLPNYNAYGKTYTTTAQEQQLKAGAVLRIRFSALMQDKIFRNNKVAVMVCSVERGTETIQWESMGINSRLWKDGQQLNKEWKELEWWQTLPADLRPTDVVKIYAWNNLGTIVYIDDLTVEVVEEKTS